MKRVVQHAKSCKRKSNQQGGAQPQAPGCPICKQLIALCCYHAKHCTEGKCPVPYCINIKHKLKQQQLQQRLQQAQILKRRIASMASMSQQSQSQQQQQHDYSPSQSQTVSFILQLVIYYYYFIYYLKNQNWDMKKLLKLPTEKSSILFNNLATKIIVS